MTLLSLNPTISDETAKKIETILYSFKLKICLDFPIDQMLYPQTTAITRSANSPICNKPLEFCSIFETKPSVIEYNSYI